MLAIVWRKSTFSGDETEYIHFTTESELRAVLRALPHISTVTYTRADVFEAMGGPLVAQFIAHNSRSRRTWKLYSGNLKDLNTAPDAYCVTTPDGNCISTDARCMHQSTTLHKED